MKRKALLAAFFCLLPLFAAGCGGGTSGNEDVVLVDRSASFCQFAPNCLGRINAHVTDELSALSRSGGAVRLLLIGSATGAPFETSENEKCTGLLRGAAACFPKPSFLDAIFGKSGTQKKAALAKIETDVATGLKDHQFYGTAIVDTIAAAAHILNDRRLPNGSRQLVILSDMIEDSHSGIPALTCAQVGTGTQNVKILNALRNQGRLPDLSYVTVEVFGANGQNQQNAACRESFWRAFFDRTGADLVAYQGL
jgi:hypothetical protein